MSHDNVNGKVNGKVNGDLISREALLEWLCEGCNGATKKGCGIPCCDYELIELAPAVDAAPVVHARWDDDCVCSACEYQNKISMKSFDGSETISVYMPTRFCPSCGAKMGLEE